MVNMVWIPSKKKLNLYIRANNQFKLRESSCFFNYVCGVVCIGTYIMRVGRVGNFWSMDIIV